MSDSAVEDAISAFTERTLAMIELEFDAEVEETEARTFAELSRRSLLIPNLSVLSSRTAFGGRTEWRLGPANSPSGTPLPAHRLTQGEIVAVLPSSIVKGASSSSSSSKKKSGKSGSGPSSKGDSGSGTLASVLGDESLHARATVSRVRAEFISVVFRGDEPPDFRGPYRIARLANDVTFQRLRFACERLRTPGANDTPLRRALFAGYDGGAGKKVPKKKKKAATDDDPEEGVVIEDRFEAPSEIVVGDGEEEAVASSDASKQGGGGKCNLFDTTLNPSQRRAVYLSLESTDVLLVHGPPGTGKTGTVVEIIRQAVARGESVLAVAASNVAVDNMVERLASSPPSDGSNNNNNNNNNNSASSSSSGSGSSAMMRIVRIGDPVRLSPIAQNHTLSAAVERTGAAEVLRAAREDADDISKALSGGKRRLAPPDQPPQTRGQLRSELRDTVREIRRLEREAVDAAAGGAQVTLATLTGIGSKSHSDRRYDVVVIDEAAQALECASWLALLKAKKRCVLAGDHRQLPPTVKSAEALKAGFDQTLFARLHARFARDPRRVCMLNVQYRMHSSISLWPSKTFYGGRIRDSDGVKSRLLRDIDGVEDTEDTSEPLIFIDTAGCDMPERVATDANASGSKFNEGEASVVKAHVAALLDAGVSPASILVLSPYSAQVALLRDTLRDGSLGSEAGAADAIDVGTVDSIQGGENEAVVISLVRSNDDRSVGFLADQRRLNVAITRAKRHLCVVGDSSTLEGNKVLRSFSEHLSESADYRSAAY